MAADGGGDIAAAFRDMLDQWVSLSNDVAAHSFKTTDMAQAMSEMAPLTSAAQTSFGETIGRVLTGINLPSRAEVLEIGVAVAALDARLERIEALLAGLVPPIPAAKPRRTRRPPAR